jgi:hypothetical protein
MVRKLSRGMQVLEYPNLTMLQGAFPLSIPLPKEVKGPILSKVPYLPKLKG